MIESSKKIVEIAGCSQKKLSHAAPAMELNQGQLFKAIKKLALSNHFELKILSGKHGLLDADQIIEPYNLKITTTNDVLRVRRMVSSKLMKIHAQNDLIIVILGKKYLEVIEPLIDTKFIIIQDKRGIGGYLSLLSHFSKLPKNQLLDELEKFRIKKITSRIPNKKVLEVS